MQLTAKLFSDLIRGMHNTAFCRKNDLQSGVTHNKFQYSLLFGRPDQRAPRTAGSEGGLNYATRDINIH